MSILSLFKGAGDGPRVERVRHEPRRRTLTVESSRLVTPAMLRLVLSGEDLADFHSLGFDDHVKLIVPGSGERRDYTPRRLDSSAGRLTLDFAIHDAGPATRWALAARPGDAVEIAGPKGSAVMSDNVRRWLLIGDETALPAIGRCVEEAAAVSEITTVIASAGPAERQAFETRARLVQLWADRQLARAADPTALLDLVRTVAIAPDTFVWIAAEAGVARTLRNHIVEERGHPKGWTKAAGYWVENSPGGRERVG